MFNECVCMGAGFRGGVGGVFFSLFDHEPESQENKMTTRTDGRTKEKENKKGNFDRVHEQNMNLWR